jgi:hypothetical protein
MGAIAYTNRPHAAPLEYNKTQPIRLLQQPTMHKNPVSIRTLAADQTLQGTN